MNDGIFIISVHFQILNSVLSEGILHVGTVMENIMYIYKYFNYTYINKYSHNLQLMASQRCNCRVVTAWVKGWFPDVQKSGKSRKCFPGIRKIQEICPSEFAIGSIWKKNISFSCISCPKQVTNWYFSHLLMSLLKINALVTISNYIVTTIPANEHISIRYFGKDDELFLSK